MAKTELQAKDASRNLKLLLSGDNFQAALKGVLPRTITPQRLVKVALSAIQQAPRLLECSPESVMLSLMRAASMGLEPDGGPLGQGYLVPFWNSKARRLDCQFIPGYRGLIKLARNSGEVVDVWAEVVFERDQFDYELGINPTLRHKRNDDTDDVGQVRYAYAVARFRDGERKFIVLNRRELDKIRASSSSKDKEGNVVGPWVDWYEEMAKKSAVRRLCKMLPLEIEAQRQIAIDDAPVDVESTTLADLPALDLDVPAIEEQPEASASQDEAGPLNAALGRLAACKTKGDFEAVLAGCETLELDEDGVKRFDAAVEAKRKELETAK